MPSPTLDVAYQGALLTLVVPTPAAGSDWSLTVPPSKRWILQSVIGTLTTDANAANRRVILTAQQNGVSFMEIPTSQDLAANGVADIAFAPHLPSVIATPVLRPQTQPCNPINLRQGDTLSYVTNALQVGDQWTDVRVQVLEWIEPSSSAT